MKKTLLLTALLSAMSLTTNFAFAADTSTTAEQSTAATTMTAREQVVQVVNKLFTYTDEQNWDKLKSEVFTEKVFLDMKSAGGTAEETTAQAICDAWKTAFADLDAVYHLPGNYIVDFTSDNEAVVKAYSIGTHYKAAATQGTTRDFVGTYDFKLKKVKGTWKLYSFVYHLKFMTGNVELK